MNIGMDLGAPEGDKTVVAWYSGSTLLHSGELDTEAMLLYEQCPTPKPSWEQLGEATRSVWRSRVLAGERADLS